MLRRTGIACLTLVLGSVLSASGVAERSLAAVLEVDAPVALADQPVRIRVAGLLAGEPITVISAAVDREQVRWRGEGRFHADATGTVDLERDAPLSGTYSGADGMGLFWSMVPANGDDPDDSSFWPGTFVEVRLAVRARGRQIAQTVVRREWIAEGVTRRRLTVAADGVAGVLFVPPPGRAKNVAVLAFGGSEGGNSQSHEAALLASHGFAALSLSYFADAGLPPTLRDIPLEYFAAGLTRLRDLGGPAGTRLVVMGYSRGTEAAMLLAEHYPELVDGVVVYAPGERIAGSWPAGGDAWIRDGRPFEPRSPLPVAHVDAPVLAIAGERDALGPSADHARNLAARLDTVLPPLIYPLAGHRVGTVPYLPAGTVVRHPIGGLTLPLGGSREGDAQARADGWPKVLAFLDGLGG